MDAAQYLFCEEIVPEELNSVRKYEDGRGSPNVVVYPGGAYISLQLHGPRGFGNNLQMDGFHILLDEKHQLNVLFFDFLLYLTI